MRMAKTDQAGRTIERPETVFTAGLAALPGSRVIGASFDKPQWLVFCALVLLAIPVKGQELVAPPLRLPVEQSKLSSMPRLYVREFRFQGNKVFSSQQLAKVTAAYVGRQITSQELEEARRAVTEYYVSHGYINSGAVLPDQDPRDGVVTMQIIEGVISATNITTENKWLRDSYIRGRVERWAGPR